MPNSTRPGRSRLVALAGFLALTSAVAATRPTPSATLTITPASHNFGQIIAGMGATGVISQFKVALPPGGGPTDSVSIAFTGAHAADFRVNPWLIAANSAPKTSTCQDSTWRSGSCDVWVEFVPGSVGAKSATLVVSDTRGNRGTAALSGTGIFGCRPHAGVHCNYAHHYSGTFNWSSVLTTRIVGSAGEQTDARAYVQVIVTVVAGVAYCAGSTSDSSASRQNGSLVRVHEMNGAVSGPGIFSIEFPKRNGKLVYDITAWCPTAKGSTTDTDFRTGETGTTDFTANPAREGGSGGMKIDPESAAALGIDLAGTRTITHPDADPANGVTGTLTTAWSFTRVP